MNQPPGFRYKPSPEPLCWLLSITWKNGDTMDSINYRVRVIFFAVCFLIGGTLLSNWLVPMNGARAQEDGGVANLEQRLTSGLRARTEEEKQYIKDVVKLVREGKLPQQLVDSSFFWVRKKKEGHPYPIFYFQRVLSYRAKAVNAPVPEFKGKYQ